MKFTNKINGKTYTEEEIVSDGSKKIRDLLDEYPMGLWVKILFASTGNLTNTERAQLAELL